MKSVPRLMMLLPALWLVSPAFALTPGAVVDNFRRWTITASRMSCTTPRT